MKTIEYKKVYYFLKKKINSFFKCKIPIDSQKYCKNSELPREKVLSEVGFEPTPSIEDQNAWHLVTRQVSLSLAP